MGRRDTVCGKWNIFVSFGRRNNLRQPYSRTPADAPDAYFTHFIGPKIAAPVDDAPTRSTAKMGRRDTVCDK